MNSAVNGKRPLTAYACLLVASLCIASQSRAEDGYELWLRYKPIGTRQLEASRESTTEIVAGTASPTLPAAVSELTRGLFGLLGASPAIAPTVTKDRSILIGTPRSLPIIRQLEVKWDQLGAEGYVVRSLTYEGHPTILIAANSDIGVLYGTFSFLRLLQTGQSLQNIQVLSAPRVRYRILDHWDNLGRSVERGYAGESIWDWHKLPDYIDPRYIDYARACASVGINGTVPNNVNASSVSLTRPYLGKLAALANVFRPYGIRVYLTAKFSAPIEIGGLQTADPLNPSVQDWWRRKADEIYGLIPDFGGFLVKANSEGEPGPQDYGRTHADGANMLADALAAHGGIVMWRAFVYRAGGDDRAKQGFEDFKRLDGSFRDNVTIQVKNGPIDFQPREPFHPLFGAMPKTSTMLEVQLTKEYLGFATHLVFLGPLIEEVLRTDTYAAGPGSTVAKVVDGSLFPHRITGIAGVANVGSDRNWTGSHFDQANWYGFGRLAWDASLSSRAIAEEWVRMTFSNDPAFVGRVVAMMMGSREAAVNYMTPLGLTHQMSRSHYGPAPWSTGGPEAGWTSTYFARADEKGIGFDRTVTGSNAVAQYAPQVAAEFSSLKRTPERLLLWFHHVPWDYRMRSGNTLWDELVMHYTHGVQSVSDMRQTWSSLQGAIDSERFEQVSSFLAIQEKEAKWWRDASIAYFQTRSHRLLPSGFEPTEHDLSYYEALCFPYVPGARPEASSLCKK